MDRTLQSPNVADNCVPISEINPRVEIDTSPPFASVKEAVTRFGGSGSWVPLNVLRLAGQDPEEMDMDTVEKQAAELEKELITKEQETLEVLRELEFAKGVMEGLKLNLNKETSSIITSLNLNPDSRPTTPVDQSTPTLTLCPVPLPPGIILTELKEAKSNLNKTTKDLTMIRASVESLNKKLRTHKSNLAEKDGETKRVIEESVDITNGFCKLTFEGQQFRRMEEAAQYEVIKATSEIENTKLSIKMVEMRLIAAKKMEEAARAMEAVARAENEDKPLIRDGITLSYEEYSVLAQKAQKAEEIFKKNDGNEFPYRRKTLEEVLGPRPDATYGRNLESRNRAIRGRLDDTRPMKSTQNNPKTRNPFHGSRLFAPLIRDESNMVNKESKPVSRSSVSIGDILSRKLILQHNIVVPEDVEGQTRKDDVSLSEMLREQSGLIFHECEKPEKEKRVDKQVFAQRKKFGFIHVSLPLNKLNKKKSNSQTPEPLNVRYT